MEDVTRKMAQRVRALLAEMAPARLAEIGEDDRLVEDLGFDSLSLIELASVLESEFGLPPIGEKSALAIKTVGDVERHVAHRSQPLETLE